MNLKQPMLASSEKWHRNKSRAVPLMVVLAIATVFISCVDRITPVELTHTSIMETFVRMDIYAKTNRAIPLSLSILPQRAGYDDSATDGWGRPLIYTVTKEGLLTLTSLGKNGKPGGMGEDADISVSFHARKPDGTLWVGSDEYWIIDAQVRCWPGN